MQRSKQLTFCILYSVCMLFLILDAETATNASRNAVALCFYTVVPSLFPFIVISLLLNSSIAGFRLRILQPICKLIRIPQGTESILLIGFLGGYPVGAQAIADGYHTGKLDHNTALRMLGFCNNAGPAFIFGMISGLFSDPKIPWVLWFIHIICGCAVGIFLPRHHGKSYTKQAGAPISLSTALEKSLKITGLICGWVIIFRILIELVQKRLLTTLPPSTALALQAILELTNGCVASTQIEAEGLRFIYVSAILGFGGLCVLGQTATATKGLGLGYYFPGKVLHAVFSILLSTCLQPFLFHKSEQVPVNYPALFLTILVIIFAIMWLIKKKTVAFSANNMYNKAKHSIKGV